ncbi:hypothetical protein RUM43_009664 [Polyplax serrata]|uniref:Reverse transcriptase n=1 Tax=Polyplax serrata TaxID=468196 RepID=A0AAN8RZS3_POLSC
MHAAEKTVISLAGRRIRFGATVSYLGVTIGRGFDFQAHIAGAMTRARDALMRFGKQGGPGWDFGHKEMIVLYKAERLALKDFKGGFLVNQVCFWAKLADLNCIKGRNCLWCSAAEDDVDHAVRECKKVEEEKERLREELGEAWHQDWGYRDIVRNRNTRTAITRYLEVVMRQREESLRAYGYEEEEDDTDNAREIEDRIRVGVGIIQRALHTHSSISALLRKEASTATRFPAVTQGSCGGFLPAPPPVVK